MVAKTQPVLVLASAVAMATGGNGPAVPCFQTPNGAGGAGRAGVVEITNVPLTGTVKWQGHPGLVTKAVPGSGDAGWADIPGTTTTGPTGPTDFLIDIPAFIRYVWTAGTGTLSAQLRGTQ
jgi:hypothetical protein